jgi:hypothetical protein
VKRVISHLNLVTNPDGATQSAMDAFDDQSLTVEQVGSMVKLTAYLTQESSAAMMTVLNQLVDQRRRTGDLAPEEQLPEGVDPETWDGRRRARERHPSYGWTAVPTLRVLGRVVPDPACLREARQAGESVSRRSRRTG